MKSKIDACGYYSHPDLGIFPFDTQKKNLMLELVDRRTLDSLFCRGEAQMEAAS
ncbi:MAG: hypothetical protein IPN88_06490 [Bacteroidetes bacterium]|nr:hypothetical protein [Bacteroidota bacterium]